jgi:hypothetical protein
MPVNSRQDLAQYCLRRLGEPVISIDVSPDQVEDRLDDALQYFMDFHYDGVERYYLKHLVTEQNRLDGFFEIADPLIIAVTRVFAFSSANINMFDVRYQVRLNDFYNFQNVSMIHYVVMRQHLALLDFLFNMVPQLRFNRKQNKIYLDVDWQSDVVPGKYLCFDCFRALDPEEFVKVYDDLWLKKYATALIKRQWGNNLSKFTGIQLPGNVILDGQRILSEAQQEIIDAEQECQSIYSMPIEMQLG